LNRSIVHLALAVAFAGTLLTAFTAGAVTPAVTLGQYHSCAVTSAGAALCWGYNAFGQLGNGTTNSAKTPVAVSGLASGVLAIAAGGYHSCALTTGGGVWCWGYNGDGELGNGGTNNSSTPVSVSGLASGVRAIAAGAGGFHTCALTSAGAVLCWGFNATGQLGNSTNTSSRTPVPVSGLSGGVTAITAGGYHTCALMTGRAAYCWGYNGDGELGNGTTNRASLPVAVSALPSGIVAIGAGGAGQTCALTSAGGLYCWGYNADGELGIGTTSDATTPVAVPALARGVIAIGGGGYHTCALTMAGTVSCWGFNGFGELGNNTTANSSVPVTGPSTFMPPVTTSASTVKVGQTSTLQVTPLGSGPFTYQWYQGTSGSTSNPIAGATGASFTTPALTVTHSYWVKTIGPTGLVEDSATITITVTGGGAGGAGSGATDGPLPLWALGALGAGLMGIASRRLKKPALERCHLDKRGHSS
jgi:alpha-tubulin suppressor-like RCC1 family protein